MITYKHFEIEFILKKSQTCTHGQKIDIKTLKNLIRYLSEKEAFNKSLLPLLQIKGNNDLSKETLKEY